MPRTTPTTPRSRLRHAPALLASARRYAEAAARFRLSQAHHPNQLARARFMEVTNDLDKLLTSLVLRTETKRRTLQTATEAAHIKATARNLADQLTERDTEDTEAELTRLVNIVLAARENEDTAAISQKIAA